MQFLIRFLIFDFKSDGFQGYSYGKHKFAMFRNDRMPTNHLWISKKPLVFFRGLLSKHPYWDPAQFIHGATQHSQSLSPRQKRKITNVGENHGIFCLFSFVGYKCNQSPAGSKMPKCQKPMISILNLSLFRKLSRTDVLWPWDYCYPLLSESAPWESGKSHNPAS